MVTAVSLIMPPPRNVRIATVPVGYADGFRRGLSNRGYVLIGGRRCTIVGAVNMNMIQVFVDHLDDVRRGDEVVLIGRQGEHEVSISSFAEYTQLLDYELMTELNAELPRRVVDGP